MGERDEEDAEVPPELRRPSAVRPPRRAPTRCATHRDLVAFTDAGLPRGIEMTLTAPEQGRWTIVRANLDRGTVQIGANAGATVRHGRTPGSMVVFHVALSGPPPTCGGIRPGKARVGVFGPGADLFEAVRGPGRWATFAAELSVIDDARTRLRLVESVYGPGESRVVRVPRRVHDELRRLVANVEHRIVRVPGDFDDAAVRTGLLRVLAERFTSAVAVGRRVWPRGAATEHARILAVCLNHLRATQDHVVSIPELSDAVRSSRRTLTRVFAGAFEVSPARYLRLRRLNQVRAWLRHASPSRTPVTDAAMRFGFFELGRFARDYRRLFGELPSETFARRAGF
jgi:AraC-like DNA-binding protein